MTELTEAFISRVFLTYRGTLLPAGALLSPFPPAGTLTFRWTPVEEFAVAAYKAVEMNLIRGTDEYWDAYQKCQDDPDLVVYVPLSRAEVQEVFGRVEKSLPFALTPSLPFPLMLMRKTHDTCLCP